jgi:hypothetical protein
MSAVVYALPMPECSSCGRFLGHLYDDHVMLTKKLQSDLENGRVLSSTTTYVGEISEEDITDFVKTYYIWRAGWDRTHPDFPVFSPLNIVARALIAIKPLEEADLPFGTAREEDGQRTVFEHSLCCLRMFQGNPLLRI